MGTPFTMVGASRAALIAALVCLAALFPCCASRSALGGQALTHTGYACETELNAVKKDEKNAAALVNFCKCCTEKKGKGDFLKDARDAGRLWVQNSCDKHMKSTACVAASKKDAPDAAKSLKELKDEATALGFEISKSGSGLRARARARARVCVCLCVCLCVCVCVYTSTSLHAKPLQKRYARGCGNRGHTLSSVPHITPRPLSHTLEIPHSTPPAPALGPCPA